VESVTPVLARRDRLVAAFSSALANEEALDPGAVPRVTAALVGALPRGVAYGAVFRTVSALAGPRPDAATVRAWSWALAANLPALRAGEPVTPGRFVPDRRVTVQVTAGRRLNRRPGAEPAARYRGRVVVGPGTPADVEWTWSLRFVGFFAARPGGLGFERRGTAERPNPHPYEHYSTLMGMRFTAEIDTASGRPRLEDCACPGGLCKQNRRLIAMRRRRGWVCPFQYAHPCHQCPKGQASCPAAVRRADLVRAVCSRCAADFTYDPAWPPPTCSNCTDRKGRRS
jgi:hypothetical protein